MNQTDLTCRDERRRAIARQRNLNGIDYVGISADQRSLCVHLFGEVPEEIGTANVRLEGGRRIREIQVVSVYPEREEDPELGECLRVNFDRPGDFSTYKLCLVEAEQGRPTRKPLEGFDPRYSCIEFSFKVDCRSDLDCKTEPPCPPQEQNEPEINYLAKDYGSFRQLILDRLALLVPDWRERHVPDIGITLVELLAYVGDYLSYQQDAVATEAYLDTARQRISVSRHARLVDYQMHEGCNARAFVFVQTEGGDLSLDPEKIYFVTHTAELERAGKRALGADDFDQLRIPSSRYDVFMPMNAPKRACDLGELKNADELINELRKAETQSTKQLRTCFSSNTQHLLAAWQGQSAPSETLRAALTDEWRRLTGAAINLYAAHSEIKFYTWGDAECCLARGATSATLRDEFKDAPANGGYVAEGQPDEDKPYYEQTAYTEQKAQAHNEKPVAERKLRLAVGDLLIFEEVIGAKTGNPADADPAHRHAVRLTKVEPGIDPLFDEPIVEIEWAEEDALPFPLCISAVLPAPGCALVENISVARGNIILVDHGEAINEQIGQVPLQTTFGECDCGTVEMSRVAGKFRPVLSAAPLTFSQPLDTPLPASATLIQDPRRALPQITKLIGLPDVCLEADDPQRESARAALRRDVNPDDAVWQWSPRRDLLSSQSDERHFVAEMDNEGRAHLRFGDGELGRKPEACASFAATYRVGNGTAGNVGADTITHLIFRDGTLSGVSLQPRNPLPARGGVEAEPMSEVKLFASGAIRKDLQRAVTADDYARLAERSNKLQRATAELRWTGSWYESRVAIDPRGAQEATAELLQEIETNLRLYRRMGHELKLVPANYVPLEIELTVCVLPHYQHGHVEAALRDAFSNRVLPGGGRGFFHADQLTFGSGIYLSQVIATAQAVEGVESVALKVLQRRFTESNGEIESGVLPLGATEIAQLNNDPSFPEQGKLTLKINGGR
jgi:hypothetical protein